ncbi:GGDEF domain-containing protein [Permianibacter sp. IMCC34836]|uniref:GGDEF domain-containing protein n=1 Tax=Permianibacter fluminis TaxID=2738515 RepID=UPI001555CA30|nr:GGDEF domain-containing protein [Permianibacter fluminis]NQD35567.1 GGDEF domain-containing protein [Permianibacter fluminis]
MDLSARAVLILAAAVVTTAATVMLYVRASRRVYPGFGFWTLAMLAYLAGLAVFALKDVWSLARPLASQLLVAAPFLIALGFRRFYQQQLRLSLRWDVSLLALSLLTLLLLPVLTTTAGQQVGVFSLLYAAAHLYLLALLMWLRDGRRNATLRAYALVLLGVAALFTYRAFVSFFLEPGHEIFFEDASALLRMAWNAVAVVLTLCLFLVLTFERTEQELVRTQQQLRQLAQFDSLTGAASRSHFLALAWQAVQTSARQAAATLVMFDLDHFKRINDNHGHASGDQALQQLAMTVQANLRAGDVFGRLGGDEFALLLPATTPAAATSVCQRIAERLKAVPQTDNATTLTLSMGAVTVTPPETIERALARADAALYRAKREGRDRLIIDDAAASAGLYASD